MPHSSTSTRLKNFDDVERLAAHLVSTTRHVMSSSSSMRLMTWAGLRFEKQRQSTDHVLVARSTSSTLPATSGKIGRGLPCGSYLVFRTS